MLEGEQKRVQAANRLDDPGLTAAGQLTVVAFVAPQGVGKLGPWLYVVAAFVIVVAPMLVLYPRIQRRSILVYAAAYTLGTVSCNLCSGEIAIAYREATGRGFAPFWRPGAQVVFVDDLTLLVLVFAGTLFAWGACRLVRGPVSVQDGTLCPGCGYSLLGASEAKCTECGREFRYQELGTTEEGFYLRQETQDRVARPLSK